MPSVWLRFLIVVFWLTTTGWLLWHDVWPNWRSGEPPTLSPDLVDEVRKGDPLKTHWMVKRKRPKDAEPHDVFRATSWVHYHLKADVFVLIAQLDALKRDLPVDGAKKRPAPISEAVAIDRLSSRYFIARSGELLSLQAEVEATYHLDRSGGALSLLRPFLSSALSQRKQGAPSEVSVSAQIEGSRRGDRFFTHCRLGLSASARPLVEFDLPSTPVTRRGSVLMPLHPVDKMRGLRPGQSWRQPLIDPLRDAFAGLPGFSGSARTLNARVLERPEMLVQGRSATLCLVMEYRDDDNHLVGRTWVERSSERVLQQEAKLDDVDWILTRDLAIR